MDAINETLTQKEKIIKNLQVELEYKTREMEILRQENSKLKMDVHDKNLEISHLQQELEHVENTNKISNTKT